MKKCDGKLTLTNSNWQMVILDFVSTFKKTSWTRCLVLLQVIHVGFSIPFWRLSSMCLNILQKIIPAHLLTFFAQIYEAYLLAPSLTFHLSYLMEFYLAYILAFQRRPRGGRGWERQAKTGSGRRVCIKSCNSPPGSRAHGPTCSHGLYTGPQAQRAHGPGLATDQSHWFRFQNKNDPPHKRSSDSSHDCKVPNGTPLLGTHKI